MESGDRYGSGSASAARYKLMSPARLPISTRSPCLTIPPGLSPTTLLDSPVLLSNMKAEPSPTTGSFNNTFHNNVGSSSPSPSPSPSPNNFEFKPPHSPPPPPPGLATMACGGYNSQQSEPLGQSQVQFQNTSFLPALSSQNENISVSSHELTLSAAAPNLPNTSSYMVASGVNLPAEVASEEVTQTQFLDSGVQETQSNHKEGPSVATERSSEDGYNWRKYGQKHVKGCEFPRSYYKCTHPNCQVKKQLERSHDGQITEIIYKGKHDHPKPQPSRRMAVGTVVQVQEDGSDRFSSLNNIEDMSNAYTQMYHQNQPSGTPEFFTVPANDDNVDEIGAQSNGMINHTEDDDDDPESKRRKKDISGVDVSLMGKATREPRVVVQTLSEVDILDDGYRWRKYGQKVVKGNPNPRSYYKCTNAGCPVRKHVERASHDPKAVITTYEGKHNHDVPAARSSSAQHDTAGAAAYQNGGMLRTRSEESDTISLDLGVGMRSSPENNNRANEMQERYSCYIASDPSGSNRMMNVYSGGGTDEYGESFSFETRRINHSSSSSNPTTYQHSMGRLMMGP